MDCPCLKCGKRCFNCHSTCELYQDYDNENKALRILRYEEIGKSKIEIESNLRANKKK